VVGGRRRGGNLEATMGKKDTRSRYQKMLACPVRFFDPLSLPSTIVKSIQHIK
jgi:hypothetical protein